MPGFNRTGPEGQGPMTGRRMGVRENSTHENDAQYYGGRGFGRRIQEGFTHNRGMGFGNGFGNRQGFRNQNFTNIPEGTEKTIIENEINTLKNQLSLLEEKLLKTKGE